MTNVADAAREQKTFFGPGFVAIALGGVLTLMNPFLRRLMSGVT